MLAARMTLPHFSVSSAMSLPKSGGDSASASPPRSASRVLSLGSARPALISLLSFSTISAGVAFGAPRPYQIPPLVARQELTHGRDVRQRFRARRCGYCERTQPHSPDALDHRGHGGERHLHLSTEQIGERGCC